MSIERAVWRGSPIVGHFKDDLFIVYHDHDTDGTFLCPKFDMQNKHIQLGCTKISFNAVKKIYWQLISRQVKQFFATNKNSSAGNKPTVED